MGRLVEAFANRVGTAEKSMSKDHIGGSAPGARPGQVADAAPMGAADWLSLAAAPVFAIMALLTAMQHDGTADLLCSAGHGSSPLSGMTLMYGLMSVFHAAPWVRLVSRRWSQGGSDAERS